MGTGATAIGTIDRGFSIGMAMELTKARLSALVTASACVGYVVAAETIVAPTLLLVCIGTALAAGGANGLNQVLEVDRDRLMERTRLRPLPSGRIGPAAATLFSSALVFLGIATIALAAGALPAALCLATAFLYVTVYTPLKTRSIFCTVVGAVVGALPPMIGWAAATGRLDTGAYILAGVLFAWQIPHFLALAWLYREDYERGGYRMLPIVDARGLLTSWTALCFSVALLPLAFWLVPLGDAGWVYGAGSIVLGAALTAASLRLVARRAHQNARSLFMASLVYLPVLFVLMVVG